MLKQLANVGDQFEVEHEKSQSHESDFIIQKRDDE